MTFPKTFNFPWQNESGFLGYPCDIVFYLSSMTTASKSGLTRQVLDGQFPWLIVTSQDSDWIMGKFPWLILTLWDSDGIMGEFSWFFLVTSWDWWDYGEVSLAYRYLSGFWLDYGRVSWILMGLLGSFLGLTWPHGSTVMEQMKSWWLAERHNSNRS